MVKKTTIYEVASLSGVSISAVSRVLNSPGHVASASRRRIVDAIIKLNFVPKTEASDRARKDFKRIGVLTPFFTAPYLNKVLDIDKVKSNYIQSWQKGRLR